MLNYLGMGYRRYDRKGILENRRNRWEFQAVVTGNISLKSGGQIHSPREQYMWLHPPESVHGWTGNLGQAAEVLVFHFDNLPPEVANWCRQQGGIERSLNPDDIVKLRQLMAVGLKHWRSPTELTAFFYDYMMHNLCALILEHLRLPQLQSDEAMAKHRVDNARGWYAANLAAAPTYAQVAEAIYISPAHLRRMFKRATGRSMREDLQMVQRSRIEELLVTTNWPLYQIAESTGFQSHEAFCRFFSDTIKCLQVTGEKRKVSRGFAAEYAFAAGQ